MITQKNIICTPGNIWKCQTVKVEMIYAVERRLMKPKSDSTEKRLQVMISKSSVCRTKILCLNWPIGDLSHHIL